MMRILPIFIPHAGCGHECVYCDQKSTSSQVEIPTPEDVVSLVEESLKYGSIDEVAFYGGSFTALPDTLMVAFLDVLQPFIQRREVGGIRLSTRPDAMDSEISAILKDFGVTTVELGCQSFDDSVLAASGRGHTAGNVSTSIAILRQSDFRIGVQLMPGLPGAGHDEAIYSLGRALSLSPDFLRVYPTVVLAGTRLADLWHQGRFTPLSLEAAVDLCADMAIICAEAAVPVIRYGLQANEKLNTDAVLAGPYHPAFGQLVKSRTWRRALVGLQAKGVTSVAVHPAELSDAIGHERSNLDYLHRDEATFSVTSGKHVDKGYIDAGAEPGTLFSLNAGQDS